MNGPRTRALATTRARVDGARASLAIVLAVLATMMVLNALFCNGIVVATHVASTPVLAVVAALVAVACATPYLALLLWVDRHEPEPPALVLAALLWGGATATGVSIQFNTLLGGAIHAVVPNAALSAQLGASFVAPVVEELAKGVALLLLYVFTRRHFDSVLDGVIYGALVGLGFAVVENWLYYVQATGIAETIHLMVLRGVLTSAGTHICFSALFGASIGLFRVLRSGVLRWTLPPAGLLLAMFAHFVWNTFAGLIAGSVAATTIGATLVGIPLAVLVLQAPFLVLIAVTALLASRHERWVVTVFLAEEAVLEAGEHSLLTQRGRRGWALAQTLLREGVGAWWARRRRFQQLTRLAFEKWHMAMEADDGSPDAREHALRVQALRRALSR